MLKDVHQISLAIRNPLVFEGLRRILIDAGFAVSDGMEDEPDLETADDQGKIVIVDHELLGEQPTASIKSMLASRPNSRVVVFASRFHIEDAARAYTAGAYAYIPHDTPFMAIVSMLQLVSMGQKAAPTELIDMLSDPSSHFHFPERHLDLNELGLTQRELSILGFLVMGLPNKAICRELGISESAVKAAVKALLRKLSVQNRTQAAIIAHESELHFAGLRSVSSDSASHQHSSDGNAQRSPEFPGFEGSQHH